MEFEIVYTEPAVKGDTQSRVLKEAKLNTGAVVQVPTFCDIGDKVTIRMKPAITCPKGTYINSPGRS